MMMSGMAGMFVFGSCGRSVFSLVKTDLNWLFRISAFSLLCDSSLLSGSVYRLYQLSGF